MKWFKKLINPCLCCGEIATEDVKEIPSGEDILIDLIVCGDLPVSRKGHEEIFFYRFAYKPPVKSPLCTHCYSKVEAKWIEEKTRLDALLQQQEKEFEINEYYKNLAIEVERKELEERAKAVGIDLAKK